MSSNKCFIPGKTRFIVLLFIGKACKYIYDYINYWEVEFTHGVFLVEQLCCFVLLQRKIVVLLLNIIVAFR